MAKIEESVQNSINLVCSSTIIEGNIQTEGDIRIDGKLHGNLNAQQRVVVGEQSIIEGNITCKDCDVSGTINGNLIVKGILSLTSTAKIIGDIEIEKLSIEPGAILSGKCTMKTNFDNEGAK